MSSEMKPLGWADGDSVKAFKAQRVGEVAIYHDPKYQEDVPVVLLSDTLAALQELRAENERLVALLRRAPKFARDVYVGDDKVSWGKQAAALVKAHETARASITKEKKE